MLLLILLGLLASHILAIPTISAKGSKFFTSDGNQFFLKGVAYQLLPEDPLTNNNQCKLDADLMKTLGANSIRIYHADPSAKHDECMKTFEDAGIYIWLDLDTFDSYIMGPGMQEPQWNETQYKAYQRVMDVFHNYDNLGGFFVGNEVLTSPNTDVAAPYVKAAARDMKVYRDAKGYRKIPVGYTAADVASLRPMLQNYLACGKDASEAVDFYGLNAYEWCGDSTFETSGYVFLQKNASEYNVPIFFSETGCNVITPRSFDDQAAIFGDKMVDTWSGAIIYEWIQETNNYGIVSYEQSATPTTAAPANEAQFGRSGTPSPVNPDFENLSKHWATLSPTGVRKDDYSPSFSPPACPEFTSGAWAVKADAPLPTIGHETNSPSESSAGTATASNAVSATDKAQPGDGNKAADEATPTAGDQAAAATSSGAAANILAPAFTRLWIGTWAGLNVMLCVVAGGFFLL